MIDTKKEYEKFFERKKTTQCVHDSNDAIDFGKHLKKQVVERAKGAQAVLIDEYEKKIAELKQQNDSLAKENKILFDKNYVLETNADIAAEKYLNMKKEFENLLKYVLPLGYTSIKNELPNNGESVMVITDKRRYACARFERFSGNEIWETDYDAEEDEMVLGWKRADN